MRNMKCKHVSKKFVALATALFLGVGMISSPIVSNAQEATSTEVATQTDALYEDTQTVMAGEIPAGAVPLDAEHFPDENFRNWLRSSCTEYVVSVGNEAEQYIDCLRMTQLEIRVTDGYWDWDKNEYITNSAIQSVKGIGYFTNLTKLVVDGSMLSGCDVSSLTKLTYLDCSTMDFTSTKEFLCDFSGLTNLKQLYCQRNQIKTLDLSNNNQLVELDCSQTGLTTLNLANPALIEKLNCQLDDKLTIDFNTFTNLKELNCSGMLLGNLDVSHLQKLEKLDCGSNNLTSLDVTKNVQLVELSCSGNLFPTVDTSKNTELVIFNCVCSPEEPLEKSVQYLDLRNNRKLKSFVCMYSNLTELDLSRNVELETLDCGSNKIKKLDLSQNTKLNDVCCHNNGLEELKLNASVNYMACFGNKLQNLDLSMAMKDAIIAIDYNDQKVILPKQYNGFLFLYMKQSNGILDMDNLVNYDRSIITDKGYNAQTGLLTYVPTFEYYHYVYKVGGKIGDCMEIDANSYEKAKTPDVSVSYATHIQTLGDSQGFKKDGQMAGTSGMAKRLENIKISVSGNKNLGIQYSTHCQTYGWLPWSTNGEANGTSGEAKRLEAIKIQLTGSDKNEYDVYYRVHAQSYGWLGWAKNGEPSGTAGYGKRLEGIQIVVKKKGEAAPGLDYADVKASAGVHNDKPYIAKTTGTIEIPGNVDTPNVMYKTHVQSIGWQNWMTNGQMSGTSGMAKRLEGINIKLSNCPYTGGIRYMTHIQKYGWSQGWKADGAMAGTSGEAKRLEAIKIELTGEMAKHYDVYYRVHAQSYGWLGWAKNGEESGTAGLAKRLEGIQIVLVPKGQAAPGDTYLGITNRNPKPFISK